MSLNDKRRVAIWGGLLAGIGLGSLLAWLLDIFEVAHPTVPGASSIFPSYPNMALTAFVVVVFTAMFGVGLGLVASTLIRSEDVRQADAATSAELSHTTGSQKSTPTVRTFFGLGRGS